MAHNHVCCYQHISAAIHCLTVDQINFQCKASVVSVSCVLCLCVQVSPVPPAEERHLPRPSPLSFC